VKNIHLTLPALLLSTLFLSACSTTPSSVKLTPQLTKTSNMPQITAEDKPSWLISSDDFRTARYLIAISSGDGVAELINESESSRSMIENVLYTQWEKQGVTFNEEKNNAYQLKVQLVTLLSEVEKGTVSDESDNNIVIKIQLTSDKKVFSKTFRSHSQEEFPFRASVDKLTEKLNTQLSQLLDQIVQDPELNAKLLQL